MCLKKMDKRGETMKRVTLRDVAELAGVSQATASLTLNHSSRANFRNGTRERVLVAARQLGYRSPARRKRRTDMADYMLLVMVPTLANPYYVELAQAGGSMLRHSVIVSRYATHFESQSWSGFILISLSEGMLEASFTAFYPDLCDTSSGWLRCSLLCSLGRKQASCPYAPSASAM